ncbi:MAG: hypothetical protein NTX05_01305 [Fusobacteria bacterium]|nr:hypothetical protein [Fusobacteriota bacterium]
MKKNIILIVSCFMIFASMGFARAGVSLDTFYTLPGVSLKLANYEIDNKYSDYISFGIGFPYGKAELGQQWKIGNAPFRIGVVEGAVTSFILQGYYIAPSLQYDISNNFTLSAYIGAMYANSPFGDAIGSAIINSFTGSNQNTSISYQWLGVGGISLSGYF